MLFRLDLTLARESRAEQGGPHDVTELGLGQQQEVLRPPAPDAQRRDQPALRRQKQSVDQFRGLKLEAYSGDYAL